MIKHCKIIFITSFRSYNLILLKLFSVCIYQNYFLLLIKFFAAQWHSFKLCYHRHNELFANFIALFCQ